MTLEEGEIEGVYTLTDSEEDKPLKKFEEIFSQSTQSALFLQICNYEFVVDTISGIIIMK